jgi:hypothetical protein
MHDDSGAAAGAVDWAAVRQAYEDGKMAVRAICQEHRISHGQLRRRYLAEGWTVRPPVTAPGPRSLARRPVDAAINAFAGLIAAQAERLTKAAGRVPDGAMQTMKGAAGALEGLMREDRLKRDMAGRKSSSRQAVGGGQITPEEIEAADEAFMRAELKRRYDVLAEALQRGEIQPDRPDEETGA